MNKWSKLLIPKTGKLWLTSMMVTLLFSSAIGALIPILTQDFYQAFEDSQEFYTNPVAYLLAIFIAEYLNRFIYQISTYKYVESLINQVRLQTYSKWINAPLKIKKKNQTNDEFPLGEVLTRIINDTDAIRELVTSGSFGIFIDLSFIISSLVSFIAIDKEIGFWLVMFNTSACLLLFLGSKKMAQVFMSVRKSTGILSRTITDVSKGLKELYFSKHQHYATTRVSADSDDFLVKQLKANVWDAGYYSTAESLYPILLALMVVVIPSKEIVSMAIIAVLIDLIQKSIGPIKEFTGKISGIQRAKTGFVRIMEFQNLFIEETPTSEEDIEVDRLQVSIPHFQYENNPNGFQLNKISFTAQKGELTGIIGQSGCGKSTILKLLSGQHGLFEGSITANSENTFNTLIADELKKVSQLVSLVSQDSHVFTETLEFNITLSERRHDEFERFWHQQCEKLHYLKTWGIRGSDLIRPSEISLGQKQLISALRACFLQKPIILFDEISSSLNPELEKTLRDIILEFQENFVTIMVSHRLETFNLAHHLIFMDKGDIDCQGDARYLEQNSQKYQEFIENLKH